MTGTAVDGFLARRVDNLQVLCRAAQPKAWGRVSPRVSMFVTGLVVAQGARLTI